MDKPKGERMKHCGDRWRSMDAKDRLRYKEKADEENEAYILSLPEDKRTEMKQKWAASSGPTEVECLGKGSGRGKRITARQVFSAEKMPANFSALSEEEWMRILRRKYAKLSPTPEDKEMYAKRAEQAMAERWAAEDAAENLNENPGECGEDPRAVP